MILPSIKNIFFEHPLIKEVVKRLQREGNASICGAVVPSYAFIINALSKLTNRPILFISTSQDSASYLYNDLKTMGLVNVGLLNWSYKKSPRDGKIDIAAQINRTDALDIIKRNPNPITISSVEGIIEKVLKNETFTSHHIEITTSQNITQEKLITQLDNWGFEEVEFVYMPGQYSQRGSILDIFSFSNSSPYRVDFFGDEIESIRLFDVEKQLSISTIERATIVPNIKSIEQKSANEATSIFNFIDKKTLILFENREKTEFRIDYIFQDCQTKEGSNLLSLPSFKEQIASFETILFTAKEDSAVRFLQDYQPAINKDFELLADILTHYKQDGYTIYISADSQKQTDRIGSILEEVKETKLSSYYHPVVGTIHNGFIDEDMKILFLTEHQIFGRFHRYALPSDIVHNNKAAMTLKEINTLQLNDYVVHINHGIGKFGGLVTMPASNDSTSNQEMIKLIYADGGMIFVPIHNLHKISKYRGGENPHLNRLGSSSWDRLKERTKKKVKDIAADLIKLYANRQNSQGFAFSADTFIQEELEASFLYQDTPDQAKATADIKKDMESSVPMDRLICGDVGFGKTELAIRAAAKALADNKQVAVLVPTTVLALQHYNTFKERLSKFPCKIEYLSRAKSTAQSKIIKSELASGKIDIIIGTHKLVGKDITFKDLGLLIIDEEHKFGVAVKEKLKSLKVNVDTLTLTATPIPRTLQFSLMGARDLSILNTPPTNRYPIATEVCQFEDNVIKEAIEREINRNGQIFFVNNRIENLPIFEKRLRAIVPQARIAVAHGGLPTQEMEQIIEDFINYEYDILLCTTIIESGVDIPNVNTIFINNAHLFALSDMHQLRGRVGRSNRKAYCYLITPPEKQLTSDARRRIEAIETFSELGSGFNIAMQDLDIRGAGNILGAEQSGFIADLGFETYQQIMNEALIELRAESAELGLIKEKLTEGNRDCAIETDLGLCLPPYYVQDSAERFILYKELDSVSNETSLQGFISRLTDRFGNPPQQAQDLFMMVRLRWIAQTFHVERLILKEGKMRCILDSNNDSPFYSSPQFDNLITLCTNNLRRFSLGEKNGSRFFCATDIRSIAQAYEIFKKLEEQ